MESVDVVIDLLILGRKNVSNDNNTTNSVKILHAISRVATMSGKISKNKKMKKVRRKWGFSKKVMKSQEI